MASIPPTKPDNLLLLIAAILSSTTNPPASCHSLSSRSKIAIPLLPAATYAYDPRIVMPCALSEGAKLVAVPGFVGSAMSIIARPVEEVAT